MQFDEFLSIVDLLKNADKYEAKVAELKDRQTKLNKTIEQLGVASNIAEALKAATKAQAKADAYVAEAQAKADNIIASAEVAYKQKFEALQALQVVADQAIAENKTINEQFAFRNDALRQKEKKVDETLKQLEADRADLSAKQADVEARLLKLRDVMGA